MHIWSRDLRGLFRAKDWNADEWAMVGESAGSLQKTLPRAVAEPLLAERLFWQRWL